MKKLVLFVAFFLSGCVTVNEMVQSPIQGSAYNSIYNKTFERPTTVKYEEMAGQVRLYIEVDEYGLDYSRVWFDQKRVVEYITLIDKFERWHGVAINDDDILNREIGIASTSGGLNIKFSFFSGNSQKHYLVMQGGVLGEYSGGIALNYENVIHLRVLLEEFKANTLNITDKSKYN
ncbi:MAG: hypothetical protein JKY26_01545 [Pseudomonas sp.]|nr:hypothetical protein [Pseudomonas sp.]